MLASPRKATDRASDTSAGLANRRRVATTKEPPAPIN